MIRLPWELSPTVRDHLIYFVCCAPSIAYRACKGEWDKVAEEIDRMWEHLEVLERFFRTEFRRTRSMLESLMRFVAGRHVELVVGSAKGACMDLIHELAPYIRERFIKLPWE